MLSAFTAALGVCVVAGGFALTTPGVLAFDDQGPAAFFRADRARHAPAAPTAYRSDPTARSPAYNIFNMPNKALTGALDPDKRKKAEHDKRKKKKKVDADAPGESGASHPRARSVCVRLCDGFHFPLGDYGGAADNAPHQGLCSSLCPGAPTALYTMRPGSDDIATAVAARTGKPYARLPVALRHQNRFDNTCSCRPNGEAHASLVSIYADLTLRRGDALMTKAGVRVFEGGRGVRHTARMFRPLGSAHLAARQRKLLAGIEKASKAPQPMRAAPRVVVTPAPWRNSLVSRPQARVETPPASTPTTVSPLARAPASERAL